MIRKFIETKIFEQLVEQEDDKDLENSIKKDILEDPNRGDIISGTNGVRKFRISDRSRGKGKRGGFRVLYLDLPNQKTTYLLLLYNKDQRDNISKAQKDVLKLLVKGVKDEYEKKKKN